MPGSLRDRAAEAAEAAPSLCRRGRDGSAFPPPQGPRAGPPQLSARHARLPSRSRPSRARPTGGRYPARTGALPPSLPLLRATSRAGPTLPSRSNQGRHTMTALDRTRGPWTVAPGANVHLRTAPLPLPRLGQGRPAEPRHRRRPQPRSARRMVRSAPPRDNPHLPLCYPRRVAAHFANSVPPLCKG